MSEDFAMELKHALLARARGPWRDDLIGAGLLAAVKAECKYKPELNVPLPTFLYFKALYGMRDEQRRLLALLGATRRSDNMYNPVREVPLDVDMPVRGHAEPCLAAVDVERLLNYTTHKQRRVLTLCVHYGMSESEAARRLGLTTGKVRARKWLGIKCMRAAIGEAI